MIDAEQPTHLAGGKPSDAEDLILERRHRLATTLLPPAGGRLLDFGCGHGAQTFLFAPHFDSVLGVDVGRGYLARFAAEARRRGLEDRVRGALYDGLRLPIPDASVDYAISFEVLEHVEDEEAALRELHRVLKPGGRLAMSVPNRWWVFETHGAELPGLPWNRVPLFSWLPKGLHDRWARARNYRRREIVGKLQSVGFDVKRSLYVTAPMDVVRSPRLRDLLRSTAFRGDTTAVPFLATAVLVLAER